MPWLEVEGRRAGSVRFRVRVKLCAPRSRVLAAQEGALDVAMAAPPVDGGANSELTYLPAVALEHGKSAIGIVSGEGTRSKLMSIAGLTPAELVGMFGATKGPMFPRAGRQTSAGTDSGKHRRFAHHHDPTN
jgi:uncharacterized protein